ncbi:MAG: LPS assembly lipoprotein LptE [Acidobacteriota bacterium]
MTHHLCRLLAALLILLAGGCGYRFSGEGLGPRPGLQRLAIPVFENSTSEPDIGAMFAGELRKEFIRKGPFSIVDQSEAEAVFQGRIKSIQTSAVSHHSAEIVGGARLTLEVRLYVSMDIRCVDARTGEVLWQDPNFSYNRVYRQVQDPNAPDPIISFNNRREAVSVIAEEVATRIHDRFLSNF